MFLVIGRKTKDSKHVLVLSTKVEGDAEWCYNYEVPDWPDFGIHEIPDDKDPKEFMKELNENPDQIEWVE